MDTGLRRYDGFLLEIKNIVIARERNDRGNPVNRIKLRIHKLDCRACAVAWLAMTRVFKFY